MTALHIGALITIVIFLGYFVDWTVDKLTPIYQAWRHPMQFATLGDYIELDDVEV